MSGGPGWIRTINLPIQRRALCWLSYKANNWMRIESGETNGIHTRATAFTEPDAASYIMISI